MAYATQDDLQRLAVPSAALSGIDPTSISAALEAASDLADSYLSARFKLPLSEWGDDLRRAVSNIAAYDLVAARGYQPETGEDPLRKRYEDAIFWLRDIAKGVVNPTTVVDASPETAASGVAGVSSRVFSGTLRGW